MFPSLYAWLRTPATLGLLAFLALCTAPVLNVLFHRIYFVILPQRAVKKFKKSDPRAPEAYLERVAATPSFLGPASKLVVRAPSWEFTCHRESTPRPRPIVAPTWRAWPRPGPGSAGGRTFPLSKQTRVAGSPIALTRWARLRRPRKSGGSPRPVLSGLLTTHCGA